MAEVTTNLRTYLLSKTAVSTIFGTRIYVDHKSEKITTAYPFAIIRTVAEAPDYMMSGALPDRSLIQIDIYSNSPTTADTGKAAIVTTLSGYRGAMSGITVGSCFITDKRGDFEPEGQIFRRSIDIQISQNG